MIGLGFSGLAAAKALHTRGLPFTCIERSDGVGGLWRYPAEGQDGPAYSSLHLNTSGKVTGYSDYPMPGSYPRYARHDQVRTYLEGYADHFGLAEHLELRTEVESVRPADPAGWAVTTRNLVTGERRTRVFAHVVAATGHHNKPVHPAPGIPGADTFPGSLVHSAAYREPGVYSGRRVLVLGIGNSACDIAVELSRVAGRVVLAMRRGAHVVPKQLMGIPIDEIAGRWWWARMPFRVQRRFLEVLLRLIRGHITDYGLPDPGHRILSAPITISDELLSRVTHGAIAPKPMIDRFDGARAHFRDGTSEEFDDVILCTGYEIEFPYLPRESLFAPNGQVALYRNVVPPDHPGLYFVGLIRPVGSITRLVEAQTEWIADLVAGNAALPGRDEMGAEVDGRIARAGQRYGSKPVDSIHVDFATYLRSVRQERARGGKRAG